MSWRTHAAARLEDDRVRIRPLLATDREDLRAAAMDPSIWTHFVSRVATEADFDALFDAMLADHATGSRIVFVIVDKSSGAVAGSSCYGNLAEGDRRLEIGWSWLGVRFQGTGINRHAKYLLLAHAFDALFAERVEFKTDALNMRARRGLVGIGATEEGTLRSFNPMPDGRRRDAVYYSVLRREWPTVRSHLLDRSPLARMERA